MQRSTSDGNGTSFNGHTIRATVNQLTAVCGEPYEYGDPHDKVQYEWVMETEIGTVFTIYDWKEYRTYDKDTAINWHIGANSGHEAWQGLDELHESLTKQNN